MTGQKIDDVAANTNMSLLHQRNRKKKKEKPSGRKIPRKGDFDVPEDDEGIHAGWK